MFLINISTHNSKCNFQFYDLCYYGIQIIFIDILSIDILFVLPIPNFVLKAAENIFFLIFS